MKFKYYYYNTNNKIYIQMNFIKNAVKNSINCVINDIVGYDDKDNKFQKYLNN